MWLNQRRTRRMGSSTRAELSDFRITCRVSIPCGFRGSRRPRLDCLRLVERCTCAVVVSGASTCRFASTKLRLSRTLPCAAGSARDVVRIPKNSSASALTFRFVLAAIGGRAKKRKSLSVIEEGRPASPTSTTPSGLSAPVITLDPSSETVSPGAIATLDASASGTPMPSVQWQISTNGGATWTPFAGATSAPYSFRAETSNNGDEFEAVFTNSVGSATTSAATLSVDAAPAVTTQPTDETALENTTAAFFAAATGSPNPTVQWEISTDSGASWQPVVGATSSCYSFSASSSANGDEYEAVFTNPAGSMTTGAATLTVTTGPETSQNWSGYVATDPCAEFDSVSASWTVPSVTCSSGAQYSAEWVGIDGNTSPTVEQDGTEGDCSGGTASYDAWYEMYGDSAINNGDFHHAQCVELPGRARRHDRGVRDVRIGRIHARPVGHNGSR